VPWVILGLVEVMLAAKPQAAGRPYYEFAVVTLFFPAIIYCALWFEPTGVGGRVCKFLGAVSYAVYAIHLPLYWLISGITKRMLHVPVESWAPWTGICFLGLLLAFCWALDKFFDRPLRSFLLARGQLTTATIPEKPETVASGSTCGPIRERWRIDRIEESSGESPRASRI
jgi:peptidoglycan/LPS O-acetylase OafA/YrhL